MTRASATVPWLYLNAAHMAISCRADSEKHMCVSVIKFGAGTGRARPRPERDESHTGNRNTAVRVLSPQLIVSAIVPHLYMNPPGESVTQIRKSVRRDIDCCCSLNIFGLSESGLKNHCEQKFLSFLINVLFFWRRETQKKKLKVHRVRAKCPSHSV